MAIILKGAGFDRRYDADAYVMIRTAVIRRVEFRDADRKPAKRFELEVHYQHRHMSNGEKGAPVSEHTATIELTPEQADMLMAPIYERLNAKIGGETDGQARTPVEVAEPVAAPVVAEEAPAEPYTPDFTLIPEEIRNLMQEGESLSSAKRRLTELLWVEQAELRNLRGTDRENLKREAEIERLLGLFARLGEI